MIHFELGELKTVINANDRDSLTVRGGARNILYDGCRRLGATRSLAGCATTFHAAGVGPFYPALPSRLGLQGKDDSTW